jgi:hypothetical protein
MTRVSRQSSQMSQFQAKVKQLATGTIEPTGTGEEFPYRRISDVGGGNGDDPVTRRFSLRFSLSRLASSSRWWRLPILIRF